MSIPILPDLIQEKIYLARAKDTDAAKWLVKEFCATVNENRQRNADGTYKRTPDGNRVPHVKPSGVHTKFDEVLLDYFVDCLEKIGDIVGDSERAKKVTADIALNLSEIGKRGPKISQNTKAESLRRGMRVWDVQRESGTSIEKICQDMAESEKKSADTIERDYKEFKRLIDQLGT